jgi:hypothetical protein
MEILFFNPPFIKLGPVCILWLQHASEWLGGCLLKIQHSLLFPAQILFCHQFVAC